MPQVIVEEFRVGADWTKLEAAINRDPSNSRLFSDDRTALQRLARTKISRVLDFGDSRDEQRLRKMVFDHDFRIKGEPIPGWIELKIEGANDKKQDHKNLEDRVERSGKFRAVVDGDLVTVHKDDVEAVLALITQNGYQLKDRKTLPEALGYR